MNNEYWLKQLAAQIRRGEFTPSRVVPNGTACWLLFGQQGQRGTRCGHGPRMIVHALTHQVEELVGCCFLFRKPKHAALIDKIFG